MSAIIHFLIIFALLVQPSDREIIRDKFIEIDNHNTDEKLTNIIEENIRNKKSLEKNDDADCIVTLNQYITSTIGKKKKSSAEKTYEELIVAIIDSNKYYPEDAKSRNISGSVKIKFVISGSGNVDGNIIIEKSSGSTLLDRAAVDSVKKSEPFPEFPDEVNQPTLLFIIDIIYQKN